MPAGTLTEWLFTFTQPATGLPYPFPVGATWEYVARLTATDLTVPPLIDVTTTVGSQGQLVVTSTAAVSSVQLNLAPAATVNLTPGEYAHALWMQPGNGVSAFTWWTGSLTIVGNAQP
jgi:hypothetical protein